MVYTHNRILFDFIIQIHSTTWVKLETMPSVRGRNYCSIHTEFQISKIKRVLDMNSDHAYTMK